MNWQDSIINFKNYLNIERGLSTNSIKSYENDLNKFLNFLQIEKNKYDEAIKERKRIEKTLGFPRLWLFRFFNIPDVSKMIKNAEIIFRTDQTI